MKAGKKRKDPEKFIYYMSRLEESPCSICFVQALCKRSFIDNSACDDLSQFIQEYIEEKENDNKD